MLPDKPYPGREPQFSPYSAISAIRGSPRAIRANGILRGNLRPWLTICIPGAYSFINKGYAGYEGSHAWTYTCHLVASAVLYLMKRSILVEHDGVECQLYLEKPKENSGLTPAFQTSLCRFH